MKYLNTFLFFFLMGNTITHTQWLQTSGPLGGSIDAISIAQNGEIYAGYIGGIFKSSNNGENWIRAGTFINNAPPWFNPETSMYYYLTSTTAIDFDSSGRIFTSSWWGRIFISTDNGISWTEKSLEPDIRIWDLIVDKNNDDVYVCTSTGIFRSSDHGDGWIKVNNGLTCTDIRSLAINSKGQIYAVSFGYDTLSGVFLSTDHGINWIRKMDNSLYCFEPTMWSITTSSKDDIYVSGGQGIFKSSDDGETWHLIKFLQGLIKLKINSQGKIFAVVQGGLWGSPDKGIWFSSDDGTSWEKNNNGLDNTEVISIDINSSYEIFIGTDGAGIFRSTDNGNSWNKINQGLIATSVYRLAIDNEGTLFAGTVGDHGTPGGSIFKKTKYGKDWQQTSLRNIWVCGIESNSYSHIFVVGAYGINSSNNTYTVDGYGIFRSTDKGENWDTLNTGLKEYYDRMICSILIINNDILIGTAKGSICHSTDNGNTWNLMYSVPGHPPVNSLATNSKGDLFAGTDRSGIFRTTNYGETWSQINSGLNNFENVVPNIQAIVINKFGDIFAGGGGYCFKSINNGNEWIRLNLFRFINSISVGPDGYIYASTDVNVYRTINSGISWESIGPGKDKDDLPPLEGPAIGEVVFDTDGYIFAGSAGYGVYRSLTSITDIKDFNRILPFLYRIDQNFPNPFNPSTTIKYELPERSFVKIVLFDMLGREIKTILNEEKEAGYHELQFNAEHLSSGVYLYRMQTGKYSQTRKMVLLK